MTELKTNKEVKQMLLFKVFATMAVAGIAGLISVALFI